MYSMLFSSPTCIVMIVALNSGSGILCISVSIKFLAVTFSCSFFWGELLHLAILSKSLSSSVLGEPVMFLAPESNGFMKRSYNDQGLVLQELSLVYAACNLLL